MTEKDAAECLIISFAKAGITTIDWCSFSEDFSDETFQQYLLNILENLLEKGVDVISLAIERKALFFPDEIPLDERLEAGIAFVPKARKLTDKSITVRVCYDRSIGEAQGQDPEGWMAEGWTLATLGPPNSHASRPCETGGRFGDTMQPSRHQKCLARVQGG